jgi:hypothetical protein
MPNHERHEAQWTVHSGGAFCAVSTDNADNMCVQSDLQKIQDNYYGDHREDCAFTFNGDATLVRTEWGLEGISYCHNDYVQVNGGTRYCGFSDKVFPESMVVSGTTTFTFHPDSSTNNIGFKICAYPVGYIPTMDVDGWTAGSGFLVPVTLLVVANVAAWVYNKLVQPGKLLYPTGQTVPIGNPRLPTVVTEDDFSLDSNAGKSCMIHVFMMLFPLWLGAIIGGSCARWLDCIPVFREDAYQPECCGELGPTPTNDGFPYLVIPLLATAPFYFWECFRSHTAMYLRAMVRDPDLFAPYIHQMTIAVPTRLSLFVRCSHIEQHTSHNSKGESHTSYTTVTTHSSEHFLEWTSLEDTSPFVGMSVTEVQDVIRQWTQSAGDKAILEINTEEVGLLDDGSLGPIKLALRQHYLNVDSSCTVTLRIDGREHPSEHFRPPEYKSAQSIQVHEMHPDPRKNAVLMVVISSTMFWLASIFFLTIPYRMYFERFTAKLTLVFPKEVAGVRVSTTEPVKTVCNTSRAPPPPTSSQMEQMQQMPGRGAGAFGAGFLASPAMAQRTMQMQMQAAMCAQMVDPVMAQQMQAAMANPAVMMSMHMGATGLPADGQTGHQGLPAGGAMERLSLKRLGGLSAAAGPGSCYTWSSRALSCSRARQLPPSGIPASTLP